MKCQSKGNNRNSELKKETNLSTECNRKQNKTIYSRALKEVIIVTLVVGGVYLSFTYLLPLFLPFVIALLLAKLLMPIIMFLHKRIRFPLIVSTVATILVFIAIVSTGVFFVGKLLYNQIRNLIQDLPIYQQNIERFIDKVCNRCDARFDLAKGTIGEALEQNVEEIGIAVKKGVMDLVTYQTVNVVIELLGVVSIIFIFIIAVVCIVTDYHEISDIFRSTCIYRVISPVTSKLASIGFAYIKTQVTIMAVNSIIIVTGLLLLKFKYAILIGIGIAVMDAFPVLGSGLFLVPMATIALFSGEMIHAAAIITIYGLCEVLRSMLEPRLLGNQIGIKPIFTLIAMYIGVELFGILGFLLGPLALVIIKTIVLECLANNNS